MASGSGTTTLVFHYVVVNADLDTDGVSIGPGPASLAGGTITDAAPNAAERAFPGLPADPGHTVHVGREPAAVASVRLVSGPRSYNAGDVIEVQVEFTKVVDVAGAPAIVVSVGDAERKAVYSAGTGTDTLLFRYGVQSGDLDEDGVSIPADSLDGGRSRTPPAVPRCAPSQPSLRTSVTWSTRSRRKSPRSHWSPTPGRKACTKPATASTWPSTSTTKST